MSERAKKQLSITYDPATDAMYVYFEDGVLPTRRDMVEMTRPDGSTGSALGRLFGWTVDRYGNFAGKSDSSRLVSVIRPVHLTVLFTMPPEYPGSSQRCASAQSEQW